MPNIAYQDGRIGARFAARSGKGQVLVQSPTVGTKWTEFRWRRSTYRSFTARMGAYGQQAQLTSLDGSLYASLSLGIRDK